jgi:hypothetical protein
MQQEPDQLDCMKFLATADWECDMRKRSQAASACCARGPRRFEIRRFDYLAASPG